MARYTIRIHGHLADHYAAWFSPLSITREPAGETLLTGDLADQGALFGLLLKIRDLGLPLLAAARCDGGAGASEALTVISTMVVPPDAEQQLLGSIRPLVELTRAEPACLAYDFYRHVSELQRFVFIERFANRAGFDQHLSQPYTQEWLTRAKAAGARFDVETW